MVIVADHEETLDIVSKLDRLYTPGIFKFITGGGALPAALDKESINGKSTIYRCQGVSCLPPETDIKKFLKSCTL